MPVPLDDRRLVKRLLAGDDSAFKQFFDENFSRLYRFVLVRVRQDDDLAAEIVQAAMTRAMQRIASFRGESALFTWLCTIARNEIIDCARKQSRYRQRVILTEDYPEVRAAVDSFAVSHMQGPETPESRYRQDEFSRLIQVALDSLPARYGNALEWKYIQGHSVNEIALKLEISPVAAQSLLARAKRAFSEIYATLAEPNINKAST